MLIRLPCGPDYGIYALTIVRSLLWDRYTDRLLVLTSMFVCNYFAFPITELRVHHKYLLPSAPAYVIHCHNRLRVPTTLQSMLRNVWDTQISKGGMFTANNLDISEEQWDIDLIHPDMEDILEAHIDIHRIGEFHVRGPRSNCNGWLHLCVLGLVSAEVYDTVMEDWADIQNQKQHLVK